MEPTYLSDQLVTLQIDKHSQYVFIGDLELFRNIPAAFHIKSVIIQHPKWNSSGHDNIYLSTCPPYVIKSAVKKAIEKSLTK